MYQSMSAKYIKVLFNNLIIVFSYMTTKILWK